LDGRDVAEYYGYPLSRWYDIGCIVAVAELTDIQPAEDFDGYTWLFEDFQELVEPFPARGVPGRLWEVTLPPSALRLARPRRKAGRKAV
jgi:hypothetical protein